MSIVQRASASSSWKPTIAACRTQQMTRVECLMCQEGAEANRHVTSPLYRGGGGGSSEHRICGEIVDSRSFICRSYQLPSELRSSVWGVPELVTTGKGSVVLARIAFKKRHLVVPHGELSHPSMSSGNRTTKERATARLEHFAHSFAVDVREQNLMQECRTARVPLVPADRLS